ncbi:MAG: tRNA pseudouridine(13) synthase TruD, partial [Pseudomonadota bacterium]
MDITSLPNSCHDKLPIAVIKSVVEDFQVDEELGFDPCGEGEHLWVLLRKRGWNTRDVIERVAAEFKIAARDVGYSGLKDRHAITTQWLSIPLAKVADRDNVEQQLTQALSIEENLSLLRVCCGQKKLRPGSHRFNRFTIVLRELCDATDETNE